MSCAFDGASLGQPWCTSCWWIGNVLSHRSPCRSLAHTRLPIRLATLMVVPAPANGSTTTCPGSVKNQSRFSTTCGGIRPKYDESSDACGNVQMSKCWTLPHGWSSVAPGATSDTCPFLRSSIHVPSPPQRRSSSVMVIRVSAAATAAQAEVERHAPVLEGGVVRWEAGVALHIGLEHLSLEIRTGTGQVGPHPLPQVLPWIPLPHRLPLGLTGGIHLAVAPHAGARVGLGIACVFL